MGKYLIEGSCDGSMFTETVEAQSLEDAEAFAIERLCEAWGVTYGADTELSDLGDAANVTEYAADDYARDAASEMLAFIEQIGRMTLTGEANEDAPNGIQVWDDPENTLEALEGLITKARTIAAAARGED